MHIYTYIYILEVILKIKLQIDIIYFCMLITVPIKKGFFKKRSMCKSFNFFRGALQNKDGDNVAWEVLYVYDDSMLLKITKVIMHILAKTWMLHVNEQNKTCGLKAIQGDQELDGILHFPIISV